PLLLLGSSALLILLLLHPLFLLLTPFVRVWVRRVWLVRRLRRGSRRGWGWGRGGCFRAVGGWFVVWVCVFVWCGRVCVGGLVWAGGRVGSHSAAGRSGSRADDSRSAAHLARNLAPGDW